MRLRRGFDGIQVTAVVLESELVNGVWLVKVLFDNKIYFVPAIALGVFVEEGLLELQ